MVLWPFLSYGFSIKYIHSFIQLLSLVVFGRTCVQKERQGLVLIAYIHGCFMRFNFFVFYSRLLRCARQYPTIYARTNLYKNSFILLGLNHFQ